MMRTIFKYGGLFTLLFMLTSLNTQGQSSDANLDKPLMLQGTTTPDDPSGIKWVSLEEAQKLARETGKKVLIFGYADWCTYCMKTRRETYTNEDVRKVLYENFIPVQLNSESEKEVVLNGERMKSIDLARYLRLSSLPTHYFLASDGEILGGQPGFIPAEVFDPLLGYIGSDLFGKVSFEDYLKETENIVIDQ